MTTLLYTPWRGISSEFVTNKPKYTYVAYYKSNKKQEMLKQWLFPIVKDVKEH